jgi:large subunit ribosomal protein L1
MSKTTQENKAKKAKKELAVEETTVTEKATKKSRKASEKVVKETVFEVLPKVTEVATETKPVEETPKEIVEEKKIVKTARVRGKKYQAARKKVDPNQLYPLSEAVRLVRETSISSFDGKVEAHVTVLDIGSAGEIVFPHLETSSKKIVILNDTILAEIKDGKISFDILIATPATMPKLLPFARTLGPKGLMPNPKSGTLTDKPEEAVKKLSVAKTIIKTEKKAPVVHIIVGKVSQPAKELEDNIAELIKVIKPIKIKKLALCATMGPSVKIKIEK